MYELGTVLDATVLPGEDVLFSNNGPLTGITHTLGTSTITVNNTGAYEINYSMNIIAGIGSEIAIAVNGIVDASTPVSVIVNAGSISGTAILSLVAGDVITLRNNSVVPLTMTLAPTVGAQLIVMNLD